MNPQAQEIGNQLFTAMEQHAVRAAFKELKIAQALFQSQWQSLRTIDVTPQSTVPSVLVACCAYSSSLGAYILPPAQVDQLIRIADEAHRGWSMLGKVSPVNTNLIRDIKRCRSDQEDTF